MRKKKNQTNDTSDTQVSAPNGALEAKTEASAPLLSDEGADAAQNPPENVSDLSSDGAAPEETQNIPAKPKRNGNIPLFFWLYGNLIFLELIIRVLTGGVFFNEGIFFALIFDAAAAFVMYGICAFLPQKGIFAVSVVFLTLENAFFIFQLFYFTIFNTFLTFFSLINGGDAVEFSSTIAKAVMKVLPWALLMTVPSCVYTYGTAKRLSFTRSVRRGIVSILLAFAVHFAGIAGLYRNASAFFSSFEYYYSGGSLVQSVNKLGLYTTSRLDLERFLIGSNELPPPMGVPESPSEPAETEPEETESAAKPEETEPNESAKPEEPEAVEVEYGDNVLDIDFASRIAETDDEDLIAMHEYFSRRSSTPQNEYTGMLKSWNLITITAEAFAPYAIDKELTPTLYEMANGGGFAFTNFYCPEWQVSTSDGEYVNNLSLIPKSGVWSMSLQGEKENYLPFVLGNQFSALGYQTHAYHNHTYTYYNRDVSHPALGYEYKGLGNGLDVKKTWPESDLEMIDVTTPEYLNGRPFDTYYMTVSGHMEYNFGGNDMAQKHRDAVEDLDLSEAAKAYLACNMELDQAMGLLLERLEEAGELDNTLIVLSPDHPPYGLERDAVSELLGHEVDMQFEYYKSTLIMYNPTLSRTVVSTPCSSLDILPTLSNLYGLPYDSRLMMGRDILSEHDPLIVFEDRSFITDKARFSASSETVEWADGAPEDPAYIEEIHQQTADMFAYSSKMIDYDYYRTVFPNGIESAMTEKEASSVSPPS